MKLLSGSRFTVRGITAGGFAALALLCLTVAGGVAWIAALLQNTSAVLVRDAESLRLVTQIELQLRDFHRLAALADDPNAQQEREWAERELEESLREAPRHAADPVELELIERSSRSIAEYLRQRQELEQTALEPFEVQRQVQPALNEAIAGLEQLRNQNRDAVTRANLRAQRIGSFFIVVAFITAVLTATLLLVMAVAIRSMLLRPILGIRDTIERFRAGEPFSNADEQAPHELREIARAFNDMSAELGRQNSRQLAFIAGIAHDLRNPLAALQFGIDAIRARRSGHDRETDHAVSVLGRQLDHLSRMVDDLLETCYIEAGELVLTTTTFDLRDAVHAVVDLYQPSAAARVLEVRLPDEPALVHADRTRIEQVIGNLLSNAIKYSDSDSTITVGVARRDGVTELEVADTGIGIDSDDIEDIFRPFWRAHGVEERSGTGLGLSVVRKIVAAHGGTITVESVKGAGSVFRVRVPAVDYENRHARREAV